MIDIIDTQNTIIKMQSDIIDELFLLLMQYMTVEEVQEQVTYIITIWRGKP